MHLSDERLAALAQQMGQALRDMGLVVTDDPKRLIQAIQRAFVRFIQAEAQIDAHIRTKIASLRRGVPEGSREWEILYQQYYEQALGRL